MFCSICGNIFCSLCYDNKKASFGTLSVVRGLKPHLIKGVLKFFFYSDIVIQKAVLVFYFRETFEMMFWWAAFAAASHHVRYTMKLLPEHNRFKSMTIVINFILHPQFLMFWIKITDHLCTMGYYHMLWNVTLDLENE